MISGKKWRRGNKLAENTGAYVRKVKRAAKIIFYRRHRQPGVKGWELRRALGKEYVKIVDLLNQHLSSIGLQVSTVYEGSEQPQNPTSEQLDGARFYMAVKEPLTASDLVMSGWRVDDVAALVVAVSYIISKQGKAARKDIEQILREKFPKWRVERSLNRYIRQGYLNEVDDVLYLDWRARAEIDQKTLIKLVIGGDTSKSSDQTTTTP
jgi:hypothetical protein